MKPFKIIDVDSLSKLREFEIVSKEQGHDLVTFILNAIDLINLLPYTTLGFVEKKLRDKVQGLKKDKPQSEAMQPIVKEFKKYKADVSDCIKRAELSDFVNSNDSGLTLAGKLSDKISAKASEVGHVIEAKKQEILLGKLQRFTDEVEKYRQIIGLNASEVATVAKMLELIIQTIISQKNEIESEPLKEAINNLLNDLIGFREVIIAGMKKHLILSKAPEAARDEFEIGDLTISTYNISRKEEEEKEVDGFVFSTDDRFSTSLTDFFFLRLEKICKKLEIPPIFIHSLQNPDMSLYSAPKLNPLEDEEDSAPIAASFLDYFYSDKTKHTSEAIFVEYIEKFSNENFWGISGMPRITLENVNDFKQFILKIFYISSEPKTIGEWVISLVGKYSFDPKSLPDNAVISNQMPENGVANFGDIAVEVEEATYNYQSFEEANMPRRDEIEEIIQSFEKDNDNFREVKDDDAILETLEQANKLLKEQLKELQKTQAIDLIDARIQELKDSQLNCFTRFFSHADRTKQKIDGLQKLKENIETCPDKSIAELINDIRINGDYKDIDRGYFNWDSLGNSKTKVLLDYLTLHDTCTEQTKYTDIMAADDFCDEAEKLWHSNGGLFPK